MELLRKLDADSPESLIDWEMTPADTYGLFECRGDMQRVRSSRERYYYFYIDNWQKPPRLCLMERGLRHARLLARILAPADLLARCIAEQGRGVKEQNYAINREIREWLLENIIDAGDFSLVQPVAKPERRTAAAPSGLPASGPLPAGLLRHRLRDTGGCIAENRLPALVGKHDFFESRLNPAGGFSQYLVDNGDGLTVTDLATGLCWQRGGTGLLSHRRLSGYRRELNRRRHAGRRNWRLPTIDEVLSLLRPRKSEQGFHVHPCFDTEQGYLFTADRRRPGGFWFVDLRQARVFWAAGTCFAGGFGRLCCPETDPSERSCGVFSRRGIPHGR